MSGGCSKLSCEIKIVGAENVEIGGKKRPKGSGSGSVFVRMYISSGNGRVQLNTRDVPVSSSANGGRFGFRWDQSFSLECNGADDSVRQLRGGSVALELRWRPTSLSKSFAVWGPSSSKLVGRAELPWGPAFSSPRSLIEAWVPLVGASGDGRGSGLVSKFDSAATGLVVAMTVSEVESGRRTWRSGCEEERCGCCRDGRGIHACQDDYELFALAAALEEF